MKQSESDTPVESRVTAKVFDMTEAWGTVHRRDADGKMTETVVDDRPRSTWATNQSTGERSANEGLLLTPKQLRTRARRAYRAGKPLPEHMMKALMKPIEEWDFEELARGRPRDALGGFRGKMAPYVTRELHERAMERFKALIRDDMNVSAITAITTIQMILESEETDFRGKPIVGAAQKLDAAKFLLEHIVGKPTQPTTTDISVRLQGILSTVMVNPNQAGSMGYTSAHMGSRLGITAGDDEEEDYIDGEVVE